MAFRLLLLLFAGSSLMAQTPKFAVNPNHIAFYGFNNPIIVSYPGKTILYSTDTNYCKTFKKAGQYYINPYFKFGNDSCKIVVRTTDKKVLHLDTLTVYIKSYETGQASIGEINGYISKERLMGADSMFLIPPYRYAGAPSFKIIKYRLIVLPKAGYLEETSCMGNKISSTVKNMFSRLNPGDIVVFDGIRAKSDVFGIEKPISPFVVTVKANGTNVSASYYRIEGYVKNENGLVMPYVFPKSNDNELATNIVKDSLWKYYKYNYITDTFELESEEFFRNAHSEYRIIYSKDSICGSYKLNNIENGGDSMFKFEQYYLNGQLYQKGMVLTNTAYSEYRHFKFSNETSRRELPLHKLALSRVPEEFYPTAYWQVYYPTGELQISLDWTVRQDTSYNSGCGFSDELIEPINKKYYYLIPKNEILIYNKEGEIIERQFPEE